MTETKAKKAKPYVGRFAPTPSGPLHFGSLVAAVASYADALANRGTWLLRLEDVDEHRTVRGADQRIVETLRGFGFVWAGEIVVQSLRKKMYRAAIEQLENEARLYVCKCSRKSLEEEPLNATGERLYPGRCRERKFEDFGHVALRFALDEDESIKWKDIHYGAQQQLLAQDIGDFVLRRSDGLFTYQLAVVVDDAEQGVTRVVRGADLLSSTARQILLQQELGLPTPEYLHVPVLVNGRGEKLSKSNLAAALPSTRQVRTLTTAWGVLGQVAPKVEIETPAAFWAFATDTWDVKALPKTMTVPYLAPG